MKMVTLVEDTCGNKTCGFEHGLCIYMETKKHKLLLDSGATGMVLDNADALGIDLAKVDTLVLSHGHYDHAGGIVALAEKNPHMTVYLQRKALGDYYHGDRYIGVDKHIGSLPQVRLLDGNWEIDDELAVFTGITGRRNWPQSNLSLKEYVDENMVQDEFVHEQCLVVTQDGVHILLSGCAHNGILNILDRYREIYKSLPQMVISGFHMAKKAEYTEKDIAVIEDTARELAKMDCIFFTGHCTGKVAFDIMKPIMGEKLKALHSGNEIKVKNYGIWSESNC